MPIPDIDKFLGIDVYATSTKGVAGVIKGAVDDFVVEEVLVDGSKASIQGQTSTKVLGSTKKPQRHLLCLLVKRNWDTFIAIKNVAKALGIDQTRIQFGGIKDAKAVTAQHITIENISAEDIDKVKIKDIQVYPIGYIREKLSLFYLLGNNFTITIKSVNQSQSVIREEVVETIQQIDEFGGIPNFFGHQRFGTIRPITHLVGKALVRGNFEEAAMLFLANPSVHEHPASRNARQELKETCNFRRALEDFPRQLRFERLMLNHLVEHRDDFVGAFQRLPFKLQALFVQAHQSYLFNRFLSERIKYGLPFNKAVVGDFVVGVERSGLPMTSMAKTVTEENLLEINMQVKAGKMRVASPIVGVKQKLSVGTMGQIEAEILTQEEIDMERLRANEISTIGGKGGLRTVAAPVRDFSLQNVSEDRDGSCRVVLIFMLFRGSYATVVLREIMKPQSPVDSGF